MAALPEFIGCFNVFGHFDEVEPVRKSFLQKISDARLIIDDEDRIHGLSGTRTVLGRVSGSWRLFGSVMHALFVCIHLAHHL